MTDKEIIKALECCTTHHTEVKCYCCKAASVNGRCTLDPREMQKIWNIGRENNNAEIKPC